MHTRNIASGFTALAPVVDETISVLKYTVASLFYCENASNKTRNQALCAQFFYHPSLHIPSLNPDHSSELLHEIKNGELFLV